MPPTLKKWGAYWFRLVRPSTQKFRALKFHIRISQLTRFFVVVRSISPCGVLPLLKGQTAILYKSKKLVYIVARSFKLGQLIRDDE